ncbi:APC family permease [Legionella cardiaca]|uniref:APC family permease n=1 Tax=Legionella cardiaca TaxID=1071983 RepID=A0ABY8APC7_9GAMM|nr:APC family permease [Legionella cardiaca]WED42101.1 APC family permease [Legionella cardiaca]
MKKQLSIGSLSLITICSVDSIRNLPVAALAGSQLLNYFFLALLFFLLPSAMIAAWFSEQSQQGVYGWVKQGLGKQSAFAAIWFQCIQNILIYPTFLSFIAGALLYSCSPQLATNKHFIFITILCLIWTLTWINLKGIHLSSCFNSFCTVFGLLLPFLLILIMGGIWSFTHRAPGSSLLPIATSYSWTSLVAIMLSFCGIEIAAVHAKESQPGSFARAIFISVGVIFCTMLFGAITLAMIIPLQQLNFISSIPQLIDLFFNELHCGQFAFLINGLIAIGCIGTANNWVIAPIKGLSFAIDEGFLPTRLIKAKAKINPNRLLITQAIIVSIISTLFLAFPTINGSYSIMLNCATQVYLLMYIMLFVSAIKIVFNDKKITWTILIWASLGLLGIGLVLIVSLIPPSILHLNSKLFYTVFSLLFLLAMILIPLKSLGYGR